MSEESSTKPSEETNTKNQLHTKTTVEHLNTVQRRLKIDCHSDAVSQAFERAYRKARSKANIKGFRPGKAPLAMIKKLYGNSLAADVGDQLINHHLSAAIVSENLRPISHPVIDVSELPKEGEDFTFTAVIDIMPDVDIKNYSDLKISHSAPKDRQELVDLEIMKMRKRSAKTKELPAETKAATGQLLTFSHDVFDSEGNKIEELCSKDMVVELGSGDLLPALEAELTGMGAGDHKTAEITLDPNFPEATFAGKTLKFDISASAVQELLLPEVDDEFAKDLGFESLADIKSQLESHVDNQIKSQKNAELEEAIFKQMGESNDFEVPPAVVDEIIDSMIIEAFTPTARGDRNHPAVKEALEDEASRAPFREEAKVRAKNTIMLLEVIKKEQIEVTDDDVEVHVRKMMGQGTPDEATVQRIAKSFSPKERENLLFRKGLDWIIEHATVTERS